jgi:uncharacterized protein (TIGR02145 family)
LILRIIDVMRKKISLIILLAVAVTLLFTGCKKAEKPPEILTDQDGNTYKTVTIGKQVWMVDNLQTTTLNDGTAIPLVEDASGWSNLTTPGYCWYNNDESSFKAAYGALYNGYTVTTDKLCPAGWHVPEKPEWQELRDFLGDSTKGGGRLKEEGTTHWLSPNTGADNGSGFTARGAGIRYFESTFSSVLSFTSFSSATVTGNDELWYTGLFYAEADFLMDHRNKKYGLSVRCLKDYVSP